MGPPRGRLDKEARVEPLGKVEHDDLPIMRCAAQFCVSYILKLAQHEKHDAPDDPTVVELDVEDVAHMTSTELAHEFPRVQIPHLDRLVVTPAHEPPAAWVEGKSANEVVVPDECTKTCAGVGIPDFDLAVVGAGYNEVILRYI